MFTILSCRDSSFSARTFGAHAIPGEQSLCKGGALGQPIVVHGYNNPEARLVRDYTPFFEKLKHDCILYSWPGGDHALDFVPSVLRAAIAGYRLRDVLAMRSVLGATAENIICHSLGSRVAMTAIRDGFVPIDKLILMAPAVDSNVFERGAEFETVPTWCKEVHVLYSSNDSVLKLAFPVGDFTGNHCALGLTGPRHSELIPKNVISHDLSSFIGDHGDYLIRAECINLLDNLLVKSPV